MKILVAILLLVHGLIHLMGFFKAFGFAEISQLSQNFSKPQGLLWLAVALTFITIGILFLLKNNLWFWIVIAAVIVSQVLIISELAGRKIWHHHQLDRADYSPVGNGWLEF